jgi:uncharacterized membrane protein YoaK (UPF0700 family)
MLPTKVVVKMSKSVLQRVLAFVMGIIAMVAVSWGFMSVMNSESFSILIALLISVAVYMVFGSIVGLFWRGGCAAGGFWIASPLFLATILSVLFTGIFTKFVSNDLPILLAAFLAGVAGCYFGQRLTTGRGTARHTGNLTGML